MPLGHNPQIQILDISNTQISDLSPLANLRTLVSLLALGNQIQNLSPIKELHTLSSINLML